MGGIPWSLEEKVLTAYYASLGISYPAIVALLARRGYTRTKPAVTNKIEDIQGRGRVLKQMQRLEADLLIVQVSEGLNIQGIIEPTLEDQTVVNQFHRYINLQWEYHRWGDRAAARAQFAQTFPQNGVNMGWNDIGDILGYVEMPAGSGNMV